MKYWNTFKRYIVKFIFALTLSFLFSYLVIGIINNNKSYYQFTFNVENIEDINLDKLTDYETLEEVKESASKYEKTDVKAMLKNNGFRVEVNENEITIRATDKYFEVFFLKSLNTQTRAKAFIKDVVKSACTDNAVITYSDVEIHAVAISQPWLISLYISLGCLVVLLIIYNSIYFSNKLENKDEKINVNESIFTKIYWKEALKPLTKVKDITTIAMLFALMMVAKLIPIPSGFGNLGLSFTYLFFATACMIYGPIYGFVIGIFSDVIGFFINSQGGSFSFLYTLQSALTGFIYGLCLFKKKVSFGNAFLARLFVNYLMNVIMGSMLWIFTAYFTESFDFALFKDMTNYYMLYISLPKNTLYLLPQSLLLFAILKALSPVLTTYKLLDKKYIAR